MLDYDSFIKNLNSGLFILLEYFHGEVLLLILKLTMMKCQNVEPDFQTDAYLPQAAEVSSLSDFFYASLSLICFTLTSLSSLPSGLMSGCQGRWTVWSFCLMNWWWRSVGVCLAVLTTCSSVKGCSMKSWLSITDTHNSRLCSATTFLTSTLVSRSYSVRGDIRSFCILLLMELLWLWTKAGFYKYCCPCYFDHKGCSS